MNFHCFVKEISDIEYDFSEVVTFLLKVNSLSFQKLLLHKYHRLLNNVQLFGYLPQTVVTQLVGAVRSEIFMSNDVLVRASARGDALYFVASGTVVVYNNVGKEVKDLE